ncbi:MAG TPA: hypothetical protein VF912_04165 [Anaeromyxobacter sp.]
MDRRAIAAALLVAALAVPAAGQDRPSEEDLFGAPVQPPAKPEPSRAAPEGAPRPEEGQLFGAPPAAQAAPPPPQGVVSREREDALRIGGQLYLRAAATAFQGAEPGNFALASPNLLDVYLDARPNDRVRGFVLGRLSYDPTLLPAGAAALAGGTVLGTGTFFGRSAANPRGVLDQLWVNFDVGRRAFVTAGRQHAKWGVGRFWNPTDYLHPVKRDPLAVFDARTGTTMLKVHVPWEQRGWNLYGVAVLEDVAGDLPRRADGSADGTNRLGRVGAGGRAEIVLGTVELGADALAQDGHRPRFGVDVSAGVFDVDVYAEAALRTSVDTPRWRAVPGADPAAPLLSRYERRDPTGPLPQVTAGWSWSVKYSDEDAVTFGGEYFYDRSGYENARIYPVLLGVAAVAPLDLGTTNPLAGQPNPFTPFYLGRHYAGAFVSLPRPGRWNDTTFTLSVLGNISDESFVARLDHSVLALTYLRVETYFAGHFGSREGEFRLGFDLPQQAVGGGLPAFGFSTDPMVFEAGVALRVSL